MRRRKKHTKYVRVEKPKPVIASTAATKALRADIHRRPLEQRYHHRDTGKVISRPVTTVTSTARKEPLMYTGDKLLGIAVMHKSALVPVFSQSEAESIAKMRRN